MANCRIPKVLVYVARRAESGTSVHHPLFPSPAPLHSKQRIFRRPTESAVDSNGPGRVTCPESRAR